MESCEEGEAVSIFCVRQDMLESLIREIQAWCREKLTDDAVRSRLKTYMRSQMMLTRERVSLDDIAARYTAAEGPLCRAYIKDKLDLYRANGCKAENGPLKDVRRN